MYSGIREIFRQYWTAYGGQKALLKSPYLHAAALLVVLTVGTWTAAGWWETVISTLPNLLGFTLGGFAMFLGFGDERFRALLAEPDEDDPESPSLFVGLCATFVHFICVQVAALVWAFVLKAGFVTLPWPEWAWGWIRTLNVIGGAIGYGLFLYAITSVIAATMQVFRIATWYEQHQRLSADEDKAPKA